MSPDNPYAPPQAVVQDAPEVQMPRPHSVTVAVWMLWIELAMSITVVVLQMRSAHDTERLVSVLVSGVLFQGLSALLNYKLWKGRNWARITTLVLFLFGALSMIQMVMLVPEGVTWMPGVEGVLTFVGITLDVVALYLVFVPGRAWFRRRLRQ